MVAKRIVLPSLALLVLLRAGLSGWFRQSPAPPVFHSFDPEIVAEEFYSLLGAQSENNEILLTVTTNHYLEISLNLICSLEQNKIKNYVVGALDRQVYANLISRKLPAFPAFALGATDGKDLTPGHFGSQEFNAVNLVKELAVIDALEHGYQVFLLDSDIVFRGDPRQFIRETYSTYDFAFQSDSNITEKESNLNAGFYYARPTNASITVLKDLVALKRKDPDLRDQPPLIDLLCDGSKRKSNDSCHDPESGAKIIIMDPLDFVAGNRFAIIDPKSSEYVPNIKPIVYHFTASGNTTKKIERIKSMDLWRLDKLEECL